MRTLKQLFEDAFTDQVAKAFAEVRGKMKEDLNPAMFDRDALELGVLHELQSLHEWDKALVVAMHNLNIDPHFYDCINDYGGSHDPAPMNQVTWTGHPLNA